MAKCINHDYRDAVSRCRQCHKPLCGECQFVTEEGIFCGEACHDKARIFHERIGSLKTQEKPASRASRTVKVLIKLTVLGLVIILALRFFLDITSIDAFLQFISDLRQKFF